MSTKKIKTENFELTLARGTDLKQVNNDTTGLYKQVNLIARKGHTIGSHEVESLQIKYIMESDRRLWNKKPMRWYKVRLISDVDGVKINKTGKWINLNSEELDVYLTKEEHRVLNNVKWLEL